MALAEALDGDNPKLKKEAEKHYNEIKNIAQGSDRRAAEVAKKAIQTIEQYRSANRNKKQKAAHGAKLDYVKSLKHICPEGQELYYYKQGGNLKCGCKGQKMEDGAKVEEAKCGAVAKFKKVKKAGFGSWITKLADATGSNGGFKKAEQEYKKKSENKS